MLCICTASGKNTGICSIQNAKTASRTELNTILDKYDIEKKFDWKEYLTAVGQCFDTTRF